MMSKVARKEQFWWGHQKDRRRTNKARRRLDRWISIEQSGDPTWDQLWEEHLRKMDEEAAELAEMMDIFDLHNEDDCLDYDLRYDESLLQGYDLREPHDSPYYFDEEGDNWF